MTSSPPTVTLDMNFLRDSLTQDRPGFVVANEILALASRSEIDAAVTSRIDADAPRSPLRELIQSLPIVANNTIGTIFRLGFSRLGGPDTLVSEEVANMAQHLMVLIFPGSSKGSQKHAARLADIDHLVGHKMANRDYFLTSEKAILDKAKPLSEKFGITVRSPSQFLLEFHNGTSNSTD